ncbi:CPXCG motif-containing cysteine-rich protein [Dyella tabacisoli]|uniref:CPXCG motif-containing cysteine-rich protein n=1 Tax=Dyella tabacisoli TaxID=2282381 RepID=A0A369UQ29_9GAMM|nr:CPXCG motif-containing cysteine-rich protein [Dyella tabacisoli]RDD82756.1 CPXCG motif-containing cysteine-rich protein [Dyella tabacisoli]
MQMPQTIHCPYCGETIYILVDTSIEHQRYIEDCHVCCQPITLTINADEDGEWQIGVQSEDDG